MNTFIHYKHFFTTN